MRSITYPCGCVNEVQPNTSLRAVHKCEAHAAARNVITGHDYYREFGVISANDMLLPTNHMRELTDALGPFEAGRQAFEVGSGCSPYFFPLIDLGFKYTGCDESEYACRVMRRHGAPMYLSAFEKLTAITRRADVVLAMHVLEHMVNPASALCKMREMLYHGGKVYILVPNNEDPVNPDHLWTFNPTALKIMLVDAGLRVVQMSVRKHIDRESWIYVKATYDSVA